MCGVAGTFHYAARDRLADPSLTRQMASALTHRGPDDAGLHNDGPLALGHTRLSIVDLTPTGRQPMSSADGKVWLAYNGELYNHAFFRARLSAQGCRFRGTSDTETLLHVLRTWGPRALEEATGIFAFAYWDSAERRLVLGRDPLGVKQLYYHDDGRRIIFASEVKALFADPEVPRELDTEALNQYLHFHTPLFERTFFKGIRQVKPGEVLEVNRHGVHARRYWQLDGFDPTQARPEERVQELRDLLETVVGDQLMSDVPVGSFFSGGIDSCAVAAFAKRKGMRLQCFGVHFTGQGVIDERPYQEEAARALGLELDLITLDGASFPEDMMKLLHVQDQPVIGAAMLPMYYVSQLASRKVKVCLGGQAGDEIFAGYARYALAHPLDVATSMLPFFRRTHHAPDGAPRARVGGNLIKQLVDLRNLRRLGRDLWAARGWRERYFENFAKVPERDWRVLFADERAVSRRRAFDIYSEALDRSPAKDPADKLQHWDMQSYLAGLFQQDDRMSMAHSLESRVPLADPRLVRFAFHTPFALKVRDGASKWILRQAVADVIPAVVLNRRKAGFDTPAERWMRRQHAGFVHDLLLSSPARTRGLFKPAAVAKLLAQPDRPLWFDRVWKLACVEAWARTFLDGNGLSPAAP